MNANLSSLLLVCNQIATPFVRLLLAAFVMQKSLSSVALALCIFQLSITHTPCATGEPERARITREQEGYKYELEKQLCCSLENPLKTYSIKVAAPRPQARRQIRVVKMAQANGDQSKRANNNKCQQMP